ncbi:MULTISPECIES: hypothetical protein [Photobacterium]|uniref:hypothetical protein n=1 Tax=Photobacterium TaxID=657 RepID=UPI001E32B330|nr:MULTISPECIES: hypothetical protein [Photobacterium]MCD9475844.1 hypothetical protein [Photobacterium phosphoreum]MCD9507706.1 hypothetical protein [Photobacterium phosphoreum]MCD9542540.1 hypothetical protein [Photobacterium carnosum]MCD9545926.1 hypothetical protein [Photobacterium carnosum]MCF2176571.1 hypothetical protein [Photobacterium phosphoreum]
MTIIMLNIRFISQDKFIDWLHSNKIKTITNYFKYFASHGDTIYLPLNPTATYGATLEELGLLDDRNHLNIQAMRYQYRTPSFSREVFVRYICDNDVQLSIQYCRHYVSSPARPFLPIGYHVSSLMGASWHDLRDEGWFSFDEFNVWLKTYGLDEMNKDLSLKSYRKCRKESPYKNYLPSHPSSFYHMIWPVITHYNIAEFREWLKAQGIYRLSDYYDYMKSTKKSERCFLYHRPTIAYGLLWKCIIDADLPQQFSKLEFLAWIRRNRITSFGEYQRVRPKLDNELMFQCPCNPLKTYKLTEDEIFSIGES